MLNVLFDRSTLKVVGTSRPALPFEVSIEDVICDDLTKVVEVSEEVVKTGFYLLPQEPLEDVKMETIVIETTEETDRPVMVTVYKQVPAGFGYYKTKLGMTTEVTDSPVMSEDIDDEGNIIEVHAMNTEDNLLYWGQVPTDEWVECFTTVEEEVQKTELRQPLFYKEVDEEVITLIDQPPLEILIDDERWTEDLQPATEVKMTTKVIRFDTDMSEFTYDEVLAHKEKQHADGSIFRNEKYQKSKGINVYAKTFDLEQKVDDNNTVLDERTQGMQEIDGFTLDKTFQLDDRTEGMKEIDDFTLNLVFELMAKIDMLEQRIVTLEGGSV